MGKISIAEVLRLRATSAVSGNHLSGAPLRMTSLSGTSLLGTSLLGTSLLCENMVYPYFYLPFVFTSCDTCMCPPGASIPTTIKR